MSFDEAGFMKQKFCNRTSVVETLVLEPWGVTEVTVRGLTAAELAKVEQAKMTGDKVTAIAKALSRQKVDVAKLKEAIGFSDKIPDDTIKRKEMLLLGIVEPVVSEAFVVKFAETFPAEFVLLSNEVAVLTGKGRELEK